MGLYPSGKFYTPFACSNVIGCATCKGIGHVLSRRVKRRTLKKRASRHARVLRRFDRLYGDAPAAYPHAGQADRGQGVPSLGTRYRPTNKRAAFAFIDRQPKAYRMRYFSAGASCTACGGSGSREAHLDELWRESVESAFSEMGISLASGEGDACDLFAEEYRDTPETEDSENEACEVSP
jgi:hypothetical protein